MTSTGISLSPSLHKIDNNNYPKIFFIPIEATSLARSIGNFQTHVLKSVDHDGYVLSSRTALENRRETSAFFRFK